MSITYLPFFLSNFNSDYNPFPGYKSKMNSNPHTREDPNRNQLIFKLVLISLSLHLCLFLFYSFPQKHNKPTIKSISVELSKASIQLKSNLPSKSQASQSSKRKVQLQKRDVFPKSQPQAAPSQEENFEPLNHWEAAEMPLLKDLPSKANKAAASPSKNSAKQALEPAQEAISSQVPITEKEAVTSNTAAIIEGDLQGRELIYQPITPPLDISHDVTITLQFSVTASGRVTNIFPLVKGDQELEQIAIKLLSQYRFEAAQSGSPDQTGLIHFTLNRHP